MRHSRSAGTSQVFHHIILSFGEPRLGISQSTEKIFFSQIVVTIKGKVSNNVKHSKNVPFERHAKFLVGTMVLVRIFSDSYGPPAGMRDCRLVKNKSYHAGKEGLLIQD